MEVPSLCLKHSRPSRPGGESAASLSFRRPGGRAEQQFSLHPQVLTQEAAGNHPQMFRSLHLVAPTPEPRYIEELAQEGPLPSQSLTTWLPNSFS